MSCVHKIGHLPCSCTGQTPVCCRQQKINDFHSMCTTMNQNKYGPSIIYYYVQWPNENEAIRNPYIPNAVAFNRFTPLWSKANEQALNRSSRTQRHSQRNDHFVAIACTVHSANAEKTIIWHLNMTCAASSLSGMPFFPLLFSRRAAQFAQHRSKWAKARQYLYVFSLFDALISVRFVPFAWRYFLGYR